MSVCAICHLEQQFNSILTGIQKVISKPRDSSTTLTRTDFNARPDFKFQFLHSDIQYNPCNLNFLVDKKEVIILWITVNVNEWIGRT